MADPTTATFFPFSTISYQGRYLRMIWLLIGMLSRERSQGGTVGKVGSFNSNNAALLSRAIQGEY